jgi:hypothetical protein
LGKTVYQSPERKLYQVVASVPGVWFKTLVQNMCTECVITLPSALR